MKQRALQIHDKDNVMVALTNLKNGEAIEHAGKSCVLKDNIPAKHKFFLNDMQPDDAVIMYGTLVGRVLFALPMGSLMTTANTRHAAAEYGYRGATYHWQPPSVQKFAGRTFDGYHRSDGRVGTSNYWIFLPTVFCENRNLDVIREALQNELGYSVTGKYRQYTHALAEAFREGKNIDQVEISAVPEPKENFLFRNIDGIKFLTHQGGCGGTRQDSEMLSRLLAAYADHPNVAGVTILSLGCQHVQIPDFLEDIKNRNPTFNKPVLVFEQQQSQSEEQLISDAIRKTFFAMIEANKQERRPAPLTELCIGVKCGGSDGFSGISANPAVGHCADLVVALGGKILLAEFPELCGVEQELIVRCTNKPIASKFIHLMRTYDQQAHQVGSGFYIDRKSTR